MAKKWLKFLKKFEDGEGKSFEKDTIIELEEKDADFLITKKFAEATDAPKLDDIIQKQMDNATALLEKAIMEIAVKSIERISKGVDEKVRSIINVNEPEEGMMGFKSAGHFVTSMVQYYAPSGSGLVLPEAYVSKDTLNSKVKKAPSGQTTIDDELGGFLVPRTIERGIWDKMLKDDQAILPQTDQRFTSGNNLELRRILETSRKVGFRHGGTIAYWMDEADEFTASKLKWGKLELKLHKLGVLYYATDEELADADVALGSQFEKFAAKAITFAVNDAIVATGTGVGKPLAVLKLDSLIVVPKEAGQSNGTILHANLNKMYYRLRSDLRSGARWYITPNMEPLLNLIQFNDNASTNQPFPIYFPPGTTGLSSTPNFGRLMGLPVVPMEYLPDVGEKGDILLANMGEYVTLQKAGGGIKSATSIHVRFLFEETAFRFSYRIGGNSLWSSPQEDLNSTTTRGPFVTLAARSATEASSGV